MKLYHASKRQGLSVLKPYPHNAVNGESVVFATSDPMFALAMTYGSGDTLASCYAINNKTHQKDFYVDELEKGALELFKNPSSLYIVDSLTFHNDTRLKKEEFISSEPVPVIEEKRIDNVFEELQKRGANLIKHEDVPDSLGVRGADPDNPFVEYSPDRFGKQK